MTDEVAFWAALSAAPADDPCWVAFADWLEEAGRPEAEFVRLFVAAEATPGEAEFRRGWKRLKVLRRSLPPAWAAQFGRVWSARPLRFRVSAVERLGTPPAQEMFDRILSLISGELVAGTLRVGQAVALPLAAGGESVEQVWGLTLMAFDQTTERLSAGVELRKVGLVWSGHRVANLGVTAGGVVGEAPANRHSS